MVNDNGSITTTDYAGNFIYENNVLQFFNTAEGYVELNGSGGYNYVYQYKDHLGNIRLSYQDKNNDGTITASTEIVEENNYYPFGLKHKGYNTTINGRHHKYMFGGKEQQDELGLNWYDITARNYDPALGRWMNLDPLAEKMRRHSPYNYAFDNPIYFIDADGMAPDIYNGGITRSKKDLETSRENGFVDSKTPKDWIKNIKTFEVKWFNATGDKALKQAAAFWAKGSLAKATNDTKNFVSLGKSFFGKTSGNLFDKSQIDEQRISYLLAVSSKINRLAGANENNLHNFDITFKTLKNFFMGTPNRNNTSNDFNILNTPTDLIEYSLPASKFKNFIGKVGFIQTLFSSFSLYEQTPDVANEIKAIKFFKVHTAKLLDTSTMLKINLHEF